MGAAGTGVGDRIIILKKQKQTIDQFKITVEGEREKDKIPALWESIKVTFSIKGIEKDKAEKAAALSMNKYCSVAETLRRAGTRLSWEINLLD